MKFTPSSIALSSCANACSGLSLKLHGGAGSYVVAQLMTAGEHRATTASARGRASLEACHRACAEPAPGVLVGSWLLGVCRDTPAPGHGADASLGHHHIRRAELNLQK